ncbi:MAG: hypothetical protein QG639_275, partial [Patescibacteria group bacterium]|nr:hypothetical protein [Patescibacteria group bacterium]
EVVNENMITLLSAIVGAQAEDSNCYDSDDA